MSQSLSAVYLHVIFSTKNRVHFLTDSHFRSQVHAYIGTVAANLDCPILAAGGMEDHVHVLAKLSRTLPQAGLVKELKRVSSIWIKAQHARYGDFAWQDGYAVFSVSESNLPVVREYIGTQDKHHKQRTFQDELRVLLKKHRVEWDEKFVWG